MESSIKLVRAEFSANEASRHLLGDVVEFESSNLQEGTLTKINPRKNAIVRPPVANVDVGIIVMSAVEPEFSTHLVDRFLVYLEGLDVKPVIMIQDGLAGRGRDVSPRGH